MLPGLIAGKYQRTQCELHVARLLKNSAANWIQASARHINAASQVITLNTGQQISFDTLSIDIGSAMNKLELNKRIPGAAEHGLCIRPIDDFATQWPAVLARLRQKPQSVVVVGAGASGVEIILAVAKALALSQTKAGLTLIAGTRGLLHNYSPMAKRLAGEVLQRAGVQVIEQYCVGLTSHTLSLHGGLRLKCDLAILATGEIGRASCRERV